jgi:undecaprenyl-diphosphatase
LILARAFFGWDATSLGLAFDVACHVGTMVAVVAFFREDVGALVAAAPGALTGRAGESEHLGRLIAVGTLPVVIVGLTAGEWIETTVRSPGVVAATLAIGGAGLVAAERWGARRLLGPSLSLAHAVVIGTAQALALVPGISRSGATLTAAMLIGFRREAAARFVFLLSLPAVAAAAGKEGLELARAGVMDVPVFAVGFGVSAVVGYLTVKYFIWFLGRHTLTGFAIYRFALAGVTVVWLLAR